MAERPIIFSGPMVRAILDGKKSQTRRILKPRGAAKNCGYTYLLPGVLDGALWWWDGKHDRVGASQPYPYEIGDYLWVREAHAIVGTVDPGWVLYRASGYEKECARHGFDAPYPPEPRWRSPIHMPRWASRLTLIVTDVRLENLQDITPRDAMEEGVEGKGPRSDVVPCNGWRMAFADLWNRIHGQGAWDDNPTVAAIRFTVHRQNIDGLMP